MRHSIAFTAFFLVASLYSGTVLAGKYAVCEDFKGLKRLYGLCNAYQNALFHEDELAMFDISNNWDKWVDEQGMPELPNRVPDVGDDTENPATCPCWDYAVIEKAICQDGFKEVWHEPDLNGAILLFLNWTDPLNPYSELAIELYAGYTWFSPSVPECRINAASEYVKDNTYSAELIDIDVETACRMDIEKFAELTAATQLTGACPDS